MNQIAFLVKVSFILLFFTNCAVQQVSHNKLQPVLIQQGKNNQKIKNCLVSCEYLRVSNNNIEFKLSLQNISQSPVILNPSMITCFVDTLGTYRFDSLLIIQIDGDSVLNDLKQKNKLLLEGKNPYASGETLGEIMTEALVTGTIAAIFGMDYEELEQSNEENENNWNEERMKAIRQVNADIEFWEKQVLNPQLVAPGLNANGVVVYPFVSNASGYVINVKLANSEVKFCFNQVYH